MIEWNTETLKGLLEAVVTSRGAPFDFAFQKEEEINQKLRKGKMVFDEVAEVIRLPHYDHSLPKRGDSKIKLDEEVVEQIRSYVSAIAKLYPDNPFHNFDHARYGNRRLTFLLLLDI